MQKKEEKVTKKKEKKHEKVKNKIKQCTVDYCYNPQCFGCGWTVKNKIDKYNFKK